MGADSDGSGRAPASSLPLAETLRQLGDQLRVIAAEGVSWSTDEPYHLARYQHAARLAAELFALADTRGGQEVQRSLFEQLTHVAPAPAADAAIFDNDGGILLIRRADDGLWAMPGGAYEMGETPAEGAVREAAEETGMLVEAEDLIGVYDSRFCGTVSSLQLFQFVFLCRPVGQGQASTPHEITEMGWFAEEDLPALSPGHAVRVPDAFRFRRERRTFIDRSASRSEEGRPAGPHGHGRGS